MAGMMKPPMAYLLHDRFRFMWLRDRPGRDVTREAKPCRLARKCLVCELSGPVGTHCLLWSPIREVARKVTKIFLDAWIPVYAGMADNTQHAIPRHSRERGNPRTWSRLRRIGEARP